MRLRPASYLKQNPLETGVFFVLGELACTSLERLTPKMLIVGVGNWIRRLFSSSGADDEAAQREEYRLPDRGELELERDRAGSFAESEAAETAKAGLDEFKAPRDQAP